MTARRPPVPPVVSSRLAERCVCALTKCVVALNGGTRKDAARALGVAESTLANLSTRPAEAVGEALYIIDSALHQLDPPGYLRLPEAVLRVALAASTEDGEIHPAARDVLVDLQRVGLLDRVLERVAADLPDKSYGTLHNAAWFSNKHNLRKRSRELRVGTLIDANPGAMGRSSRRVAAHDVNAGDGASTETVDSMLVDATTGGDHAHGEDALDAALKKATDAAFDRRTAREWSGADLDRVFSGAEADLDSAKTGRKTRRVVIPYFTKPPRARREAAPHKAFGGAPHNPEAERPSLVERSALVSEQLRQAIRSLATAQAILAERKSAAAVRDARAEVYRSWVALSAEELRREAKREASDA